MRFKTIALASCFSLLAGIIVVPAGSSVNQDVAPGISKRMQLADGMPLPLPPRTTLVADGMPLPLPPRATDSETTLVADGMPLPLPPRIGSEATHDA